MKKKFIGIIILILITGSQTPLCINASKENNLLDGGWIEEIDDIKVLFLSGTHYEMGYQQGILLKDDIKKSYRSWFSSTEKRGVTKIELLEIWNQSKNKIPQYYIDEIQGIADGANISYNDVAAIAAIGIGIYMSAQCSCYSAWGNATRDGKLYHVRSSDWSLHLKDPDSNTFECNRQIVIVRNPDFGYDSVSISLPGCICVEEGINERKIVTGYTNVLVDV